MTSYTQTEVNPSNLSNEISEFCINLEENSGKYRDIPVLKKFDEFDYWENMPTVKETKNMSFKMKGNACYPENISAMEAKSFTGTNKKRVKPDTLIPITGFQFKPFPDNSFPEKARPSSISEPSLFIAKDRGDNIALQSFYREDNLFARKYSAEKKSGNSKDNGISGCIYIKHGGKTFKSVIDANILVEDDTRLGAPRVKKEKHGKPSCPTDNSLSRHKLRDCFSPFETNGIHFSKEGMGDFEIAIFLSGVTSFSEKNPVKTRNFASSQKKDFEINNELENKRRKKKKNARKNDSIVTIGNNLKMLRANYEISPKTLTVNQYKANKRYGSEREPFSKSKTFRMHQYNANKRYNVERDQIVKFVTPSESESESVSDIFNKTPKTPKRFKYVRPKICSVRGISYNDQEVKSSHKLKKNDAASYRSKLLSQSSFYEFSDVYRLMPRMKVSDGELWEKFEAIFRSYASTTRHSGEVIPRKISTEWLTNAGVVDDIMTDREADDAFRHAAGAKITMNAQEYKAFLIMLTLRMKLPYYEIYRRMCGI